MITLSHLYLIRHAASEYGVVIHASFAYFFGYGISALPPTGIDTKRTSITHWFRTSERPRWVLERFNDYGHLTTV